MSGDAAAPAYTGRAVAVLAAEFYARPVVEVARDLIGCTLEHDGAAGVIVETEAYHESEPACHAFVGLTPRTSTLFGEPAHAYVYRSYGIHALFNAVCEPEGVGAAVLIRALHPIRGIERMRARRWPVAAAAEEGSSSPARPRRAADERELCSGPGKLTQALGIELAHNGASLLSGPVRIAAPSGGWRETAVLDGTRIGISRAVELRWRFCAAGDPHVSRPHPAGRAVRARPPRTASRARA
jgi:DNA-3-methyladenine glycosylase